MSNGKALIPEKILREFDGLVKEAGVSQQEFLCYISKFYNIDHSLEEDKIDYEAYYESFIA
ncbi:MAG: hypothetical protein K0R54_1340 [Clostridiaceae bacterium]|jgi:hypothetical protein|nr:hypothetical protein [Clostridiaceae bacterium]